MSVEENTLIIEKWINIVNAENYDGYADLFSDDVVLRSSAAPDSFQGKETARQQLENLFIAFPDYQLELINSVVAEDEFACEIGISGTHKGQLDLGPTAPPIPATGNQFRLQGIFVATVKKGKVSELRTYPNIMGLMRQLGLMSPPKTENGTPG